MLWIYFERNQIGCIVHKFPLKIKSKFIKAYYLPYFPEMDVECQKAAGHGDTKWSEDDSNDEKWRLYRLSIFSFNNEVNRGRPTFAE